MTRSTGKEWRFGHCCDVCDVVWKPAQKRAKGMCMPCYYKVRRLNDDRFRSENRRVNSLKQQWDSDTYLGLQPDSHDWARLAAYVDGEGTIGLSPRQAKGNSLTFCGRVIVTNTDFRLALWCAETFGMTVHSKPRSPGKRVGREGNWKDCYFAQAASYRACWILRNCLTWFVLKRAQAEIVIEHQRTMGSFYRASGVKTPDNVLQFRQELKQKLTELNRRGPNELGSNTLGLSEEQCS